MGPNQAITPAPNGARSGCHSHHVLPGWLALLFARIVETVNATTWTRARAELQRLHVGTFTGPAGLFRQTGRATDTRRLHTALDVALPPRILDLDTEQPATR